MPPAEVPEWVRHTVRLEPLAAGDFAIPWEDGVRARAIGLVTDQVVTESLELEPLVEDGSVVSDPRRDLVKIAVAEGDTVAEGDLITYGDYTFIIGSALALFAALVAPEALCPDRRSRVLSLYLASPLTRMTYLLSKAASVAPSDR